MYMETKKEQKNETKEKKPLTERQRRQRQKMLVYPLMGLTFLGCMWLIFAPSSSDREKARQGQGFNTDMPLPEDAGIIGDKAKAYEQQQLENRQKQRRGMVGDPLAWRCGNAGHGGCTGRLPPDTGSDAPKGNGEPATCRYPLFGYCQQAAEHVAGDVL